MILFALGFMAGAACMCLVYAFDKIDAARQIKADEMSELPAPLTQIYAERCKSACGLRWVC